MAANGDHLRYIPAELARAMVEGGSAEVAASNGRVRSVKLIETASTHLVRIGEPGEGRASGVRFTRWVRLDASGTRVVEHHPRCRDYED